MIPMSLSEVAAAIGSPCPPDAGDIRIRRITTDSRSAGPGDLFVAIKGDRFDGHEFIDQAASKGAVACLCCRDGVDRHHPAASIRLLQVGDTITALGALAAHYRARVMPASTTVVAVTGSNGKTTTKCMIDHVLRGSIKGCSSPRSYNNAIGVPLSILATEADDRYLIAEIGTNAPGEVAALAAIVSPDVAVITSIGEAHTEGLGDLHAIAAEKASLLDHVRAGGLAVVNIDRPELRANLRQASECSALTFGRASDADLRVIRLQGNACHTTCELCYRVQPRDPDQGPGRERRVVQPRSGAWGSGGRRMLAHSHSDGCYHVELSMPGVHHATNAAAAFGVAREFGLTGKEIVDRLGGFAPVDGRTQLYDLGDLRLIDDAYNANPASMAAALETMRLEDDPRRRVFVMGDMLELGSFSSALHRRVMLAVYEAGIDVLVAVGPAMADALEVIGALAVGPRIIRCDDADAAGDLLLRIIEPGDTVWIKGSRAMQLDRVVSRVRADYGRRLGRARPTENRKKYGTGLRPVSRTG